MEFELFSSQKPMELGSSSASKKSSSHSSHHDDVDNGRRHRHHHHHHKHDRRSTNEDDNKERKSGSRHHHQPKIIPHLTDGALASHGRHNQTDKINVFPSVPSTTSVAAASLEQSRSKSNGSSATKKTFINGGRCGQCNLCQCACANSNNPFSGCGSPFIDDGSYLNRTLNQIQVPYGFVSGRDAVTFTPTVVVGSSTGDIELTPTTTLAAMQAATGLSALTRRGQQFFIGSTTPSDPVVAVANGMFEIVSLPTEWNSTYVIRPQTVLVPERRHRRDITTLMVGDLIQIMYAAPTVGPCVSGNNVYYAPGNQGNIANALFYQIEAIATTPTPVVQPFTLTVTITAAIVLYNRIKASTIPDC